MGEQPAPRRYWRINITMADGTRRWCYVRCPYLVETEDPASHGGKTYRRPLVIGDEDYPDTYVAMTARLGVLEWERLIDRYRVDPVPLDRMHKPQQKAVRTMARRWREIEAELLFQAA